MKRFITLLAACAALCGCSDESIFGEATKTHDPGPDDLESGSQGAAILKESNNYQLDEGRWAAVSSDLELLKKDLKGMHDQTGKLMKYDQFKDHFSQTLKEAMPKPAKFQFIADHKERWVYRCNLETGEIECFSMSVSNKLRLLSSIK